MSWPLSAPLIQRSVRKESVLAIGQIAGFSRRGALETGMSWSNGTLHLSLKGSCHAKYSWMTDGFLQYRKGGVVV